MLKLSLEAQLPLIYVRTDDILNVKEVLSHIAGEQVNPINLAGKPGNIQFPDGRVFFTSSDCVPAVNLYHQCVEQGKTIVFVNSDKSSVQFDAGTLMPPKELVLEFLTDAGIENPVELLPSFGGLTLKDIGEVAKLTMTRDSSLTVRGVAETRRAYTNLKGITQVDTDIPYYVCPSYLSTWLKENEPFFKDPKHPALTPRGLLFDGPPGTGKTLASMHIASVLGVPLYRLDLGAMMGKYVGQSEESLNAALAQIDQVAPCAIIFDEVEKVFQSQGDSGVTSRLLSQLLWWLQAHKTQVFTVMTTNDVSKIPDELYREGRIDQVMQFLGVESESDGYSFALGAVTKMLKDMDSANLWAASTTAKTKLTQRVKTMFSSGSAVPQSKLSQVAYALVKELVADTSKESGVL